MKQLKQIIKSINKNRLNSSVIIISLAFGITCSFLISVFIQHELNPESFNPDKHRTFALQCNNPFGAVGGTENKMIHTRYGSAEYMQEKFTEVESFCRIIHSSVKQVTANRNSFHDKPILVKTSSNFFSFFNYKLLSNNKQTILQTQNDIAISKELALKYFGEQIPIGKPIHVVFRNEEKEFFVSGVFEKPIETSQLKFDMVTLIGEQDSRCYVKLDSPLSEQNLEEEFERLKDDIPVIKGDKSNQYDLLPMNDAYFSIIRRASFEISRDKTDLWIAAIVALMILGIALFNYLILIRNRLNDNVKTYTINRIQGAENKDLVQLFMRETFALLFIAVILGFAILHLSIPFFNELLTTSITISVFKQVNSLLLFAALMLIVLFITYLFVLVHIRTQLSTRTIKGTKSPIRIQIHGMNILQLAATIILLICSSVILKQIRFINNKEIGLDKSVTEIKIPKAYQDKSVVFKEELRANPTIKNVSLTSASPLTEHFILLLKYQDDGVEKEYYPCGFSGDANFVKTLGIKIIEGENFSGNPEVDKRKCLINKSMANAFPHKKLIGEILPGSTNKTIIGIVEDFHFSNLKRIVQPAFIDYNDNGPHVLVKANDGFESMVEASITSIWANLIPDYPVNFENLGLRYKSIHKENKNFIRLIGSCCLISIFLSMMGLFAISVDNCIKRTKEIGIRKVNGAKISEILNMLNRNFIKWVIVALLLAFPIAYYAMTNWLSNFAYKTELSWWIFALAGVLVMGITLLTVSWQSWRAATKNPIEALRYE